MNGKKGWTTELAAGATTFFTMSYILFVNPSILSSEGTGMPFSGVLTATALLCFSMTLMMGVYAKLPFAVAPGMGINAFFTYSIIIGDGVAWPQALGIVFWAGALFLLVSLTPIREKIATAIPPNLRSASACGIGMFLTFIGLKNMGLIVADPVTLVKFGGVDRTTLLSLTGLGLSVVLVRRKNPFSFLVGIFVVTFLALFMERVEIPQVPFAMPDFQSVFLKLDIWGALKLSLLPAMVSILLTDLFDSISTFVGVSRATGLVDSKGQPKNLKEGLVVDAFATLSAGLFGTSSGTAYIESASGIEVGGRTGLTAVFTALFFLPCLFLAPIASIVPAYATAPVLVIVGAMMFRSVNALSFGELEDLIPAFLTIILIPLTFSITQGILWGFISHITLYVLVGKGQKISPTLWALGLVSVLLLWIESSRV